MAKKTTAAQSAAGETRSVVCSFRMTPATHRKIKATLAKVNARPEGKLKRVYGLSDFALAAVLALLADELPVCEGFLDDLRDS